MPEIEVQKEIVELPPIKISKSIDIELNPVVPRLKLGASADSDLPTYRFYKEKY